jgi:hypothetical protein
VPVKVTITHGAARAVAPPVNPTVAASAAANVNRFISSPLSRVCRRNFGDCSINAAAIPWMRPHKARTGPVTMFSVFRCCEREPEVIRTVDFGSDPKQTSARIEPLVLALPSEGSYHLLTGVDGAGLLAGSKGKYVSLQFEEPDLGRTCQNLVPR